MSGRAPHRRAGGSVHEIKVPIVFGSLVYLGVVIFLVIYLV